MRPYKFSMEKILNLREDLEKDKMEKMVVIQNELEIQKKVLQQLLDEEDKIKNQGKVFSNIQDLKQKTLYKSMIKKEIEKQDDVIEDTKKVLDEKRNDLIEAQKDRKIMEKLKEKGFEEYKIQTQLEEQKELDEIAVLKYNNKDED